MKSDAPNTQAPERLTKWEYAVFYVASLGSLLVTDLLCKEKLHGTVLLSASIISIGNAIYYGVVRKGLRHSFRLGLAIFFSVMTLIGFALYQLVLHSDEVSQWDFLVELFGAIVLCITIIFIYKHRTPSFWN